MDEHRFPTATAFLEEAGPFLAAREAEHNLIFGICAGLAADPTIVDGVPYLATVSDHGVIVAAAIQTPPRNVVLSETDDLAAIEPFVDGLAAGDRTIVPGVVGPPEAAAAFARRWTDRTGIRHEVEMRERIFRLTALRAPRPAPGAMRTARLDDRDLLVRWLDAFGREAFPPGTYFPDAGETIDRWLTGGYRTLYLWDDGGPMSMCGVGGETPNGTRIGPVYTPPERRGRGYASSLVAGASQAQLDRGRRFCFLYTDLANPTSNHIYQEIGYEPVRDADSYVFG
jgi:uncharacterized protein